MIEEWRDIKGYENEYRVSNMGRVMSLLGKKPRILKPSKNKRGYLKVQLHCNNDKRVHRLVAEAFIDNPNNYREVNHKDENPCNNRVDNLEWCTHKYNLNYGTCQQRARDKQKETFPQLNRKDLSLPVICLNTLTIYPSIQEASRHFGIRTSLICRVCKGKQNHTNGLKFMYVNKNT